MEPSLTIEEAKYLMQTLDDDIPYWQKKKIALLLLILASNPELVENNREAVGYSPRSYDWSNNWEGSDGDYYGY